ncbi:MAG: hypothetical protein A2W18_03730 [Candidatus Muproteobacteria bacterium RBG_16_60_9]|uniref:Enoyl-CoA hydratase/isomerase domain-containing protein n=1 Tax=Candidatus Muproteobacteria bacterium RBG_16_60_9 TaxID=1817755 RepID=A0A1F6UY64_9PROT|nr:MAG: hypothetical protein A2W18_03730 [Candidatus Muproteobacteria bacterium RBG_16_60_9]
MNAGGVLFESLADFFVPNGEHGNVFDQLLSIACSDSPRANHRALSGLLRELRNQNSAPVSNLGTYLDIVNEVADYDSAEEILAALESRAEHEPWLQRAAQTLGAGVSEANNDSRLRHSVFTVDCRFTDKSRAPITVETA